jgi:midasin (ATPase involved in ribosome maturation)
MGKCSLTYAVFDVLIQGALVEAVIEGWWILLDEVNLASADTLQCLSGVLEERNDSLLFLEKPYDIPCLFGMALLCSST